MRRRSSSTIFSAISRRRLSSPPASSLGLGPTEWTTGPAPALIEQEDVTFEPVDAGGIGIVDRERRDWVERTNGRPGGREEGGR